MPEFFNPDFLQTGDIFTAKDKLGKHYRYKFLGIDLHDLLSGTGCAYIELYNMDSGTRTCVEGAWFRERTIKKMK